jgi:hypothetical protein
VTNSAHVTICPTQKSAADRCSGDEGVAERRHLLQVLRDQRRVDAGAEGDGEGEQARALHGVHLGDPFGG